MKKVFAGIMAGMMILSSYGCDKKEGNGGSTEVITFWSNSADTKDVFNEKIEEFNKGIGQKNGVKIEYTVMGGDYATTLDMAIASDNAPDIAAVPGSLSAAVKKGNLYPISKIDGMNDIISQYKAEDYKAFSVDGDIYGLPTSVNTYALCFNKDMFKNAGIVDENGEAKPPQTWEELVEDAKKLTDEKSGKYGIALPMKWSGFWSYDFLIPAVSGTGMQQYNYNSGKYEFDHLKPYFEYLLKIKEDKSFFPGAEGLDNDPARSQFSIGNVAMIFGAAWDVGVYNTQFICNSDWGVAKLPLIKDGEAYKQPVSASAPAYVMSAAEKKDMSKVGLVVQWLYGDDLINALYENERAIPFFDKFVKDDKQSKNKGWNEFSELVKESMQYPQKPSVKVEGDGMTAVFDKIWAGTMSIDEGLSYLDDVYSKGLEKAIKNNEINHSDYVYPDFNSKI